MIHESRECMLYYLQKWQIHLKLAILLLLLNAVGCWLLLHMSIAEKQVRANRGKKKKEIERGNKSKRYCSH